MRHGDNAELATVSFVDDLTPPASVKGAEKAPTALKAKKPASKTATSAAKVVVKKDSK
jgi:hypothetical protein